MKDSEDLELDWLLKCKLEELIASVRPMSAKNCEQYVRAILGRIGGPSFEQFLMRIVETMVPRDGRGPPMNSDEYYFAIRDLFPMCPQKMMSWANFYVLLCECANCGSKRIPISPSIEKSFYAIRSSRTRLHAFQESRAEIIRRKRPNVAQAFDAA